MTFNRLKYLKNGSLQLEEGTRYAINRSRATCTCIILLLLWPGHYQLTPVNHMHITTCKSELNQVIN